MTVGPVQYDPQTDILNNEYAHHPTYSSFDAVRVYISNLTNSPAIAVCNALAKLTHSLCAERRGLAAGSTLT